MKARAPRWRLLFVLVSAGVLIPALGMGAKRPGKVPGPGEFNPAHETVELFAAVEAGQIEVKFIPKNAERARVFVTNKTAQPLNVRMPEAFAAVPVVAQFGPGNGLGQNGLGQDGFGQKGFGQNGFPGGGGGNQGAQSGGGGFGPGGNGGNQNGNMFQNNQGMFNVAAEKVGELKVALVCLEHGKSDPRPAIPYQLVPIETVTSDPAVAWLLAQLARDRYPRRTVQAAAWHLANGMSWEELSAKRIRRAHGARYPYFSARELNEAKAVVQEAQRSQPASPAAGESLAKE